MAGELDRSTIEKAYARWAPVYDLVFGAVFERGRTAAIEAAERACGPGGRILEVGVGTGISLPDYDRSHRLVGIDISVPMLRKAQERVIEHKLDNVEALAVMDAKHLGLPDASFDVVVAQYVITAVPDPEATLARVRPRAQTRRRDRSGQSHRRRDRAAPRLRAVVRAGGATARLAAGISLGPACKLGGKHQRHAADRAPADAAARAFLADPVCQGRCRCRDCRRGAGRALILPVSLSAPILVAPVLLAPLQFAPLQLPLQRAPLQFAPIVPFV